MLGAFLEGWRRVLRAPALTASVLGLTLLLALPLAMRSGACSTSTWARASRRTARRRDGTPGGRPSSPRRRKGWAARSPMKSSGSEARWQTSAGSSMRDGSIRRSRAPSPPISSLWIFLSGGILDRLARARPVGTAAFFSACGVYFFRFLRLGVIIGAAYWVLFRWLHPLLFDGLYDSAVRDMTSERQAIVLRASLYLLFAGALAAVNVVADFAKVRAVVEDRRSMIAALGASLRFIRRRPWRVGGVVLLNVIALLVILRLWLQVAPARDRACVVGVSRLAGLPAGARVGQALVHRLGGRILPGRAGARRLHGVAGARVARLAGGRGDRESEREVAKAEGKGKTR